MEFVQTYKDDDACLEWLWRNRYSTDGKHAQCPKCKVEREFKKYETKQRRQSWTCTACGQHVHPTAGTIFEGSSTSLHLWFYAMYLMSSTRCGISAKQIERELGVTYKTAWRMANLIRNQLMEQDEEKLEGHVEADETWIGGKPRAADIRYPGRLPLSLRQVAAGLPERVRMALQPSPGAWRPSDVRGAPSPRCCRYRLMPNGCSVSGIFGVLNPPKIVSVPSRIVS
jgi:transposase-like protein